MNLIPKLLTKRASESKRSEKGQTELEFMLVLPFFLAVVFGLLMFVMLVFKGEMLTYATFMAGRVMAVKHPLMGALSDAQNEARQILPGVTISTAPLPMPPLFGPMTVTGSYQMNPLVKGGAGNLDYSFISDRTITANIDMHHFQSPQLGASFSCDKVKDDNCYTQW